MKHKVSLMLDSGLLSDVGRAASAHGRSFAAEVRAILTEHYHGSCELCGFPAKNGRLCWGCSWAKDEADSEWRTA